MLALSDALALQHGRLDDASFEALKSTLGDEEILELTYITAMYLQHSVISRALRLEFDDHPEPVAEVPGDHRSLA